MKILVINAGSSSIKYQLFDMDRQLVLVSGLAEKIGEETSKLTHRVYSGSDKPRVKVDNSRISDHQVGMTRIVNLLVDPEFGVIRDKSEISAIGHRVVHGGETFQSSVIIDDRVIAALKENIPLAPLHNPHNLTGIECARKLFPGVPQVGVFDTAFHHTIPEEAFLYALPYRLYKENRIRRYGFHGTSHAYVAAKAAEYLGRPLNELNLITIHLGNGASMAAIRNGKSVDTSMGMTPLEGLVMGTRSGDVDPSIPFFLAQNLKMTPLDIDKLLNHSSGLKGICGTNDMRQVYERSQNGDESARIALKIYCYRIKKYIGAYFAVLGRLDAVVFTAGIGENAPYIRELSCRGLERLGIEIDPERNNESEKDIREVNSPGSFVKILVIPTNEELRIAQETKKVIEKSDFN